MANTPQSEKRARQARGRRLRGQSTRARCRTMIKKAHAALGSDGFKASYTEMQSELDSAVTKGILHRNTVARIKKRTIHANKRQTA